MLTVDLARRSLELANARGLSRSALVRQLLSEALDTAATSVTDDGSPGDQMTIGQWRDTLPGPLGTPLPDEATARLAYLTFGDWGDTAPDLADFEEWRSRRVMADG